MAGVYKNASGGDFTLPDGTTVRPGCRIDIDAATLKVPGVAQFVDVGGLVEIKQEPKRAVRKPSRGTEAKERDE